MICPPDIMQYGKMMIKNFEITSLKNEKIKKIIKLKNKNKRDKYSLFLIEGYRELLRAYKSNVKIDSLYVCESLFLKDNENALIEKINNQKTPIYNCLENVFRKISYRDRPDGLLAIAKQFKQDLKNLEKIIDSKKDPLIIICEAIEKPGNLGTILRTADATKVDAVIVVDPLTDIFNPNVVRASIGALFSVPIFVSESEKIISFLKKKNINILSATPKAKINYSDVNLKKGVAIAFGTEQLGLTDIWFKNSSLVKIPMFGDMDSLNVAQSTTILLYEAIRQRKLS
ncbi:MAG: 23S rRNA (guanosine-2'-O-)-methyltransferase RlmB [Candidatus Anoxychlamydiales bacterium]|nr:23S rRNA (guanosine-2'-O-)-methyltransferase RlmB [Candidatus Anoxychlamydiales bacterium]